LIKTDMVVGQTITFEKDGFDSLEYLIVGTFQLSKHNNQNNDRLWIFTDGSQLEPLMNIFSRTTADVYTYMLSFTVEGQILQDETHQQMQILSSKISELITEEIYGDWKIQPSSHPDEQTVTQARQILLNLGIWIVGGAIISILFAWIISRFRRREVAILKSMGYSNRHVRSTLIAEILTISFLGFVFGIGSTQSYLFYLSDFSVGAILRWQAALWSFVIMVVITIPGMVLASLRVLRISPAEAFRQN
ncbi:MAG: ABC transporter permease, partial [Candidatus Heimdallarchaeota archaeon]|nr:ABC transporter permease [Candidatus Heimdallarchaeota archaeon]